MGEIHFYIVNYEVICQQCARSLQCLGEGRPMAISLQRCRCIREGGVQCSHARLVCALATSPVSHDIAPMPGQWPRSPGEFQSFTEFLDWARLSGVVIDSHRSRWTSARLEGAGAVMLEVFEPAHRRRRWLPEFVCERCSQALAPIRRRGVT
jgi:hypothetical protein